MEVQYLTNEKGKKTAVQLDLKQWDKLQKDIKKLEVLNDLKQAFEQMKLHEEGKLKTPTTTELLASL